MCTPKRYPGINFNKYLYDFYGESHKTLCKTLNKTYLTGYIKIINGQEDPIF